MEWISKKSRNKINLKAAKRPSKSVKRVEEDRYALVFDKSRYINDDNILFANHSGTYSCICITFRVSADHEQILVSNFEKKKHEKIYQEISVTSTEIHIWMQKNMKEGHIIIPHATHKWTTLFVGLVATADRTHGSYIINGDAKLTGSFTIDTIDEDVLGFSVGSRYDDTRFLNGEIASIELYHERGKKEIPQALKDLIIRNQLIESIEEEHPVKKKKKKKILQIKNI